MACLRVRPRCSDTMSDARSPSRRAPANLVIVRMLGVDQYVRAGGRRAPREGTSLAPAYKAGGRTSELRDGCRSPYQQFSQELPQQRPVKGARDRQPRMPSAAMLPRCSYPSPGAHQNIDWKARRRPRSQGPARIRRALSAKRRRIDDGYAAVEQCRDHNAPAKARRRQRHGGWAICRGSRLSAGEPRPRTAPRIRLDPRNVRCRPIRLNPAGNRASAAGIGRA